MIELPHDRIARMVITRFAVVFPAEPAPDSIRGSGSKFRERVVKIKLDPDLRRGDVVDAIVNPRVDLSTPPSGSADAPFYTLDDDEREASLLDTLAAWNRRDSVWVFGYGSLIWRPDFEFDAKARGLVYGYHRSMCLWSKVYRGTPEKPGLVLGLEPGGSVHGVAFRIPAAIAHRELRTLWARELVTGSYLPRWLEVRLGHEGTERVTERVRAIGFVMNRMAEGYAGELDRTLLLDTVCSASGRNGTCAEYVLSTVQSLAEYDIHDRHLAKLAEEVGVKITLPAP